MTTRSPRHQGDHERSFRATMAALELRPGDLKGAPPERVAQGALAQIGLGLAMDLDRPECFGRAGMAKELRLILDQLTLTSPGGPKPDDADSRSFGGWDTPS